jgi:hypothetical protein
MSAAFPAPPFCPPGHLALTIESFVARSPGSGLSVVTFLDLPGGALAVDLFRFAHAGLDPVTRALTPAGAQEIRKIAEYLAAQDGAGPRAHAFVCFATPEPLAARLFEPDEADVYRFLTSRAGRRWLRKHFRELPASVIEGVMPVPVAPGAPIC